MRDAVMEALDAEDARLSRTENEGPVCSICGYHVNNDRYHYDMDGTIVCCECISEYAERFKVIH